jgi:hypothetical protein
MIGAVAPQPVARTQHLASDQHRKNNWELGMIGFAAGTMLSGLATGYFWSHASHVALQPNADGGTLSYAGSF